MVKAREFWNCLCKELDYRFFAGVPCKGLALLYNSMNSKIMHYVPAVNNRVALGLVSGAFLSGAKVGVLIHIDRLHNILDWLISFNLEHKIPPLIIAYYDEGVDNKFKKILSLCKIPYRDFLGELRNLKFIVNKIERLSTPGICIIGKGEIEK